MIINSGIVAAAREEGRLAGSFASAARPMTGSPEDLDPVLERIGDAGCVLLGEATHGTHEFYALRAELTRRLIVERGFAAVAVEADWADAYRVNRWVRWLSRDAHAEQALDDFRRFPTWTWRNRDMVGFIDWLRQHNLARAASERVGFYGLDVYGLQASIRAVLDYLDAVDPEAAARARYRYGCFEHFGEDAQAYGYAASFGLTPDCERQAVEQLVELATRRGEVPHGDGLAAEDAQFHAEQNARVVKNAEAYYRTMFEGRVSSWNLRDTHMADTLDSLRDHLRGQSRAAKVVVWAHNSHVGDARATELGEAGELTLGQLARQRHADARLIGFTTYEGTVIAAGDWGAPAQVMTVRPALAGSYEALLHHVDHPAFFLDLSAATLRDNLGGRRLERAVGVIYAPRTERISHYFHADLFGQLDALIHVDRTRAVQPLERWAPRPSGQAPETFPTGM